MGHITALANKLSAMADKRAGVAAALEASAEWQQWRASVLQPRNEREDVNRWACGRPSTQEMASRAASAEDPMLEASPQFHAACTGTGYYAPCTCSACCEALQTQQRLHRVYDITESHLPSRRGSPKSSVLQKLRGMV